MTKAKLQAATLGGACEEIEGVFYEALQRGDIEQLMQCWADEDDVICVHPGGGRLVGMAAIRASFEALFANGSVHAVPEQVHKVQSLVSAVHSVLERIEVMTEAGPRQACVLATNVYHKTPQGWRMVAHHASPGTDRELPEVGEIPSVLH